MKQKDQLNLAIFASGKGTNAENIIEYFQRSEHIKISVIFTNNPKSGVFQFAISYQIPVVLLSRDQYMNGSILVEVLQAYRIDLIVLAGYLKKIPLEVVQRFPRRIINIHPALLPKFGGKGMYGLKVHQKVLEQGELQSGISIHYVDEIYDHGELIFQAKIDIDSSWGAEDLAKAIHKLEYEHYPLVIEKICEKILS